MQSGSQGSMATFRAVIAIDPIEGQSIYSGQSVDYQITTASVDDCLMVPTCAIVNTDNGTAVFAKPRTNENGEEIPLTKRCRSPRVRRASRRAITSCRLRPAFGFHQYRDPLGR